MAVESSLTEATREALIAEVRRTVSSPSDVSGLEVWPLVGHVEDETCKAVACARRQEDTRFLLITRAEENDLILRNYERANLAKSDLGERLGEWVLVPLRFGVVDGYRYAIYPYCRPLPNGSLIRRLYKRFVLSAVDEWLYLATRQSRVYCNDTGVFVDVLEHVISRDELPEVARLAAREGLHRLQSAHWHPFHVLMHNDLFYGNILRAPIQRPSAGDGRKAAPYVVIDWAGAERHGFAFYDLFRMHRSFGSKHSRLLRSVIRHCQVLECSVGDVPAYLAAAIGWLGIHLEHFQIERYVQMVDGLFTDIGFLLE